MTGSQSHRGARVHWNDVMLRHRYDPLTAYKQSKLCNLLFAKGLNDRYAALGIHAYVVDPGLVHTDIGDKAGGIAGLVWRFRKTHGAAPEIPAQTYASSAPKPSLSLASTTGKTIRNHIASRSQRKTPIASLP